MADGPFRGEKALYDDLLERDIRAEIADLRTLRREATIDAAAGFVGCALALWHAHQPWNVLFEIFSIPWFMRAASVTMFFWGVYNAANAFRLRHAEDDLS